MTATRSIGVLIDLPANHAYHEGTRAALAHAADALEMHVDVAVITTDRLDQAAELSHDAIVIGPGSPYRNPEGVLSTITSARERGVPLVGT
jgi:CTP synthase (UTP-ammonia lyase)